MHAVVVGHCERRKRRVILECFEEKRVSFVRHVIAAQVKADKGVQRRNSANDVRDAFIAQVVFSDV